MLSSDAGGCSSLGLVHLQWKARLHFAHHANVPPNPHDSHRSLCLCAFVVVVKDGGGGGNSGGEGEGRGCEPTLGATASTASLAFLTTADISLFNFSLPFLPMMGYLI